MFTFFPEEPEYFHTIRTYNPRSHFAGCRQHNQPPCSYHLNPYSSYSHPCSDLYLTPTHSNHRNYHRNYNQGAYRDGSEDDTIFLKNLQRDSSFTPENFFNVQPSHIDLERISQRSQGRKFHNNGEELRKKTAPSRESRSIPITTPSDSNSKTMLDKCQASKKIYKFLRYDTANHKTRKVLSKLLQLRTIQNELTKLMSPNDQLILTFITDQKTPQVLPISKDNRKYLEHEDTVLKILSKLDEIDSNGYDIVRRRRREIVGLAQGILNRLDEEKERQWKEFKAITIESDNSNKYTEGERVKNNNTVTEEDEKENSMAIDDVSEEKVAEDVVTEEKENSMAVDDVSEEKVCTPVVADAQNNVTQSPSSEVLENTDIKSYSISQTDDVKEIVLADEAQKDTTKDAINSFAFVNMDVDELSVEDTESESPSFVDQEKSGKKADDEFVMIESDDLD